LVPPRPGKILLLDFSVIKAAMGCMLAQMDDEGIERAVYYLLGMLAYEENYSAIEKTDCAMYVKKWHKCQPASNIYHL
jgi:hypothetical protein